MKINKTIETVEISLAAISYMNKIMKIGSDYKIKPFTLITEANKKDIEVQTFLMQFSRMCNVTNFTFNVRDTDIKVTHPVRVSIKGITHDGRKLSKKATVISEALTIRVLQFEKEVIKYSVELDSSEYDEGVLISRVKPDLFKDFQNGEFTVEIVDSEKDVLKTTSDLFYWLTKMPKRLNYKTEDKILLADLFDVLNARGLTDATGNEIVCLKEIYHTALNTYPLFEKLSLLEQIKMLEKAYKRACLAKDTGRDIYLFSKAMFEVLTKSDMHKRVKIDRHIYEMVKEYRCDCYIDGRCYEKNALKTIWYECKINEGFTMKSSFIPSDLWRALVPNKYESIVI